MPSVFFGDLNIERQLERTEAFLQGDQAGLR